MAQGMTLEFSGLERFKQALARYQGDTVRAAAGALYREGERIMTKAKLRCPVDTGTLRSTGQAQQPQVAGTIISVVLGFGGPAAPYALVVHEDLQARHTVGEAKFLQTSVNEAVSGFDDRLAADIAHG